MSGSHRLETLLFVSQLRSWLTKRKAIVPLKSVTNLLYVTLPMLESIGFSKGSSHKSPAAGLSLLFYIYVERKFQIVLTTDT